VTYAKTAAAAGNAAPVSDSLYRSNHPVTPAIGVVSAATAGFVWAATSGFLCPSMKMTRFPSAQSAAIVRTVAASVK
jgi:hypothetical protein